MGDLKTQIAAAMSDRERLYLVAVEILQKRDPRSAELSAAVDDLIGRIKPGAELVVALFDDETDFRAMAGAFLRRVANEMLGGERGHKPSDNQRWYAPASRQQSGGDECGQDEFDNHDYAAHSSSPQDRERPGHGERDNHSVRARLSRDTRAAEHGALTRAARSIYDTFRTSRGVLYADIPARALPEMVAQHEKAAWVDGRDAVLLRLCHLEIGRNAHIPERATVRDVIGARRFEELVRHATEAADMRQKLTFSEPLAAVEASDAR